MLIGEATLVEILQRSITREDRAELKESTMNPTVTPMNLEENSNALQLIRSNYGTAETPLPIVIETSPINTVDTTVSQQYQQIHENNNKAFTQMIHQQQQQQQQQQHQRSLTTVINSGRRPSGSFSPISNVTGRLAQSEKAHNNYLQQQQQTTADMSDIEQLLKNCDQMLESELVAETVAVTPPTSEKPIRKSTSSAKNKALVKKQQKYACTLSSANLLRTLQKTVGNTANDEGNFIMVPLSELTKYQDQWMKQPSDALTLDQRESLGILLRKSTRTKMKQQARLFCRTNQPIEEIQRGSLCFIYYELFQTFNPMRLQLVSLGPMKRSSALVALTNVIPVELLKKVFDYLFSIQAESRKNAAPNSKKNMMSIDDLMQTKESAKVFSLINEWLWQHLPTKEAAMKMKANGVELPLQTYVSRLQSQRAEIVLIMKALEENQCENACVDSFQKMIVHVQARCESVNTQLQTQSARVKLGENISQINKMNVSLLMKSKQPAPPVEKKIVIDDNSTTTTTKKNKAHRSIANTKGIISISSSKEACSSRNSHN